MTIATVPYRNSAAYLAAAYLHREGPKSVSELFAAVNFGRSAAGRREKLQRAIVEGWLCRLPGCLIGLTDFAQVEFEEVAPAPKGKVAEPRIINVMARKPYVPPKRLPRDDEPEWSRRIGATFYKV